MSKFELFGIPITVGEREALLLRARALLGRGGYIVTVNPLMLMRARRDGEFREILKGADLVLPDGVGVKLALALLGVKTDVLPGVELAEALIREGAWRVALYGAKPGVARRAADTLLSKNPNLTFSMILDGYTYSEREALDMLSHDPPDLLYVCLGAGRQERAAASFCKRHPSTLAIGLGGSFDVIGGNIRRAPPIIQRLRLEWLYRMVREPRRLSGLPSLALFLWLSLLRSVGFSRKSKRRDEKK